MAETRKIDVSHKFINIMSDLYSKANMVVKTSEGFSEKCKITKGVLQGETLSPIFYSLYISDLADFLYKKDLRGVQLDKVYATIMLAFADDMVFLSKKITNIFRGVY